MREKNPLIDSLNGSTLSESSFRFLLSPIPHFHRGFWDEIFASSCRNVDESDDITPSDPPVASIIANNGILCNFLLSLL